MPKLQVQDLSRRYSSQKVQEVSAKLYCQDLQPELHGWSGILETPRVVSRGGTPNPACPSSPASPLLSTGAHRMEVGDWWRWGCNLWTPPAGFFVDFLQEYHQNGGRCASSGAPPPLRAEGPCASSGPHFCCGGGPISLPFDMLLTHCCVPPPRPPPPQGSTPPPSPPPPPPMAVSRPGFC